MFGFLRRLLIVGRVYVEASEERRNHRTHRFPVALRKADQQHFAIIAEIELTKQANNQGHSTKDQPIALIRLGFNL